MELLTQMDFIGVKKGDLDYVGWKELRRIGSISKESWNYGEMTFGMSGSRREKPRVSADLFARVLAESPSPVVG